MYNNAAVTEIYHRTSKAESTSFDVSQSCHLAEQSSSVHEKASIFLFYARHTVKSVCALAYSVSESMPSCIYGYGLMKTVILYNKVY